MLCKTTANCKTTRADTRPFLLPWGSQGFGLYDISHLCAGVGAWGREWECEDGICYNIVDKNKIEYCKISYPEFYNNDFFSSRENVNFPAFNDGK